MAVNKVEYGDDTLIDLTEDTVTPSSLMSGVTAHGANGEVIVGTFTETQADWAQNDSNAVDYIKNKPSLDVYATQEWTADVLEIYTESSDQMLSLKADKSSLHKVATSGNYNDLSNKPTIPDPPTKTSQLTNDSGFITAADIPSDDGGEDFIVNFTPTSSSEASSDKSTSEIYSAANSGKSVVGHVNTNGGYIMNFVLSSCSSGECVFTKFDGRAILLITLNGTTGALSIVEIPMVHKVATSGDYNDLRNKPTIPEAINGDDGITFTPAVSSTGVLSWTNDGGLDNPSPVNITGPQGPTGPQGDPGQNGAPGAKGEDGYTPIKGVDYFDGQKGDKGDKGDQGTPGDKGDKGDKGDPGYTPIKGTDYFDGEKGETGAQGPTGPKGEDGYTPIKGVDYFDGAPGTNGDEGDKGDKGDKGDPGTPGTKGDKGDPGYTPIKGIDYFTDDDKYQFATDIIALLPAYRTGNGTPNNSIGNNGDLYFDLG